MNSEVFKNNVVTALLLGIILAIAVIIFYPFAVLFALNCIFPMLSIPYSFASYTAICILNLNLFVLVYLAKK